MEETKNIEEKENIESNQHAPLEQRSAAVAQLKGISFALIECALRYHEAYITEDIAVFGEQVIADCEKQNKEAEEKPLLPNEVIDGKVRKYKKFKLTPAVERKQAQQIKGFILNREQKGERFRKALNERIAQYKNELSIEEKEFFQYIQKMGLVLEEFVKAKDHSQFLMISTMYNQGKFDHVFEELKKESAAILVEEPKILTMEEIQKRDNLHKS